MGCKVNLIIYILDVTLHRHHRYLNILFCFICCPRRRGFSCVCSYMSSSSCGSVLQEEAEVSTNQNGPAEAPPSADSRPSTVSLPLPPYDPDTPVGEKGLDSEWPVAMATAALLTHHFFAFQAWNTWRKVSTAVSASCSTPTRTPPRRRTAAAVCTTTSCRWVTWPRPHPHLKLAWHHLLLPEIPGEGADQREEEEEEDHHHSVKLLSHAGVFFCFFLTSSL